MLFGTEHQLIFTCDPGVLLDSIRDGGAFTFFAPSKEAFKHLGKLTGGHFRDKSVSEHLTDLLADHILPGTVMSTDVPPHGLKVVAPSVCCNEQIRLVSESLLCFLEMMRIYSMLHAIEFCCCMFASDEIHQRS